MEKINSIIQIVKNLEKHKLNYNLKNGNPYIRRIVELNNIKSAFTAWKNDVLELDQTKIPSEGIEINCNYDSWILNDKITIRLSMIDSYFITDKDTDSKFYKE